MKQHIRNVHELWTVLMCSLQLSRRLNDLWQAGHSNGFTSKWITRWRLRCPRTRNTFSQCGQTYCGPSLLSIARFGIFLDTEFLTPKLRSVLEFSSITERLAADRHISTNCHKSVVKTVKDVACNNYVSYQNGIDDFYQMLKVNRWF